MVLMVLIVSERALNALSRMVQNTSLFITNLKLYQIVDQIIHTKFEKQHFHFDNLLSSSRTLFPQKNMRNIFQNIW